MPLRRAIRPWIVPWLLALLAVAAVDAAIGLSIRNSIAQAFDASERIRSARTVLFASIKGQLDEESGIRGYIATHDPEFLQPYGQAKATLANTLASLTKDLQDLGFTSAVAAAADAQQISAAWRYRVAEQALRRRGRTTISTQKFGKSLMDKFRYDLAIVDNALRDRNLQLESQIQQNLLWLTALTFGSALAMFGVGAAFAFLTASAWRKLAWTQQQHEEARVRATSLRAAYSAEKRVADTLQQAFVQRRLPKVASLAIDAVYVPAAEERLVGGDWYDALDMGNKGIFLVIGDVAGHGVEAAVTMSRARDEVFAAAVVEPDPAAVLVRVNEALVRQEAGMITAVVGLVDENAREFRYAIAGHPPPLLVKRGETPARLECGELPLGVTTGVVYKAHSVKLPPGSALVLYTDGAIEQSHDIIAGESALSHAVVSTIDRPDAAREIYRAIFTDASPRDDVAILTVQVTGDVRQPNEPARLLTHAVSR